MSNSLETAPTKISVNRRVIPGNPLAVISALIGVVELAFAYPVTQLSGSNQTVIVWFMVIFPFALLLAFFLIVWFKPAHLYAPKDYQEDKGFLEAIGKAQPPRMHVTAEFPDKSQVARQSRGKKLRKDLSDITPLYKEGIAQKVD